MKNSFHSALVCAALVLAGCAMHPAQPPTNHASGEISSLGQALTFHVFMGELALQRGAAQIAVHQYADAAQLSQDPALAQFATLLAYSSGDDPLAMQVTHRWLQLAPGDAAARHYQAVLNARLGNTDAAVAEFKKLLADTAGENLQLIASLLGQETSVNQGLPVMQKLVADDPGSAQAHFALAQLAMHFNQPRMAADEARRALELQPRLDQAAVLEAHALLALGNSKKALQLLKTRTLAQPSNTSLRLAYAALLVGSQQLPLAQAEFDAVLRQDPNQPDALYSLGLLALQGNALRAAADYFTRLLKTGQRENEARFFLGDSYELSRHYDQALHWYRQVNGGSQWLAAQISIARIFLLQRDMGNARKTVDDAVILDPDAGVQLRIAESELFSDHGDNDTALVVLNQGLLENPGNTDLLYTRALLRDSSGDPESAESDLREVLSREPDDADALNALGYVMTEHSGNYLEARAYITRALKLKPDDPAIIDSMGWVEFRLGNYPQALDYLRKSYAKTPDPEVAAHLTETLWASGNKQEAHQIWSGAMQQHPGNAALIKIGERLFP
ncbi:MAG: tetratricopeptide repeat protein [Gammaproteobacteria bacterium]|nr:tetratricopeptide repeat protein [Gammaproteobacteria bacterium]